MRVKQAEIGKTDLSWGGFKTSKVPLWVRLKRFLVSNVYVCIFWIQKPLYRCQYKDTPNSVKNFVSAKPPHLASQFYLV